MSILQPSGDGAIPLMSDGLDLEPIPLHDTHSPAQQQQPQAFQQQQDKHARGIKSSQPNALRRESSDIFWNSVEGTMNPNPLDSTTVNLDAGCPDFNMPVDDLLEFDLDQFPLDDIPLDSDDWVRVCFLSSTSSPSPCTSSSFQLFMVRVV